MCAALPAVLQGAPRLSSPREEISAIMGGDSVNIVTELTFEGGICA